MYAKVTEVEWLKQGFRMQKPWVQILALLFSRWTVPHLVGLQGRRNELLYVKQHTQPVSAWLKTRLCGNFPMGEARLQGFHSAHVILVTSV